MDSNYTYTFFHDVSDYSAGIEESATSIQSCNSSITYYNNPPYNNTTNTSSGGGGSNGGQDQRGGGRGGLGDDPVLTERDRKELMSLVNENISMDFILEMKEAFQLFDKVCMKNVYRARVYLVRTKKKNRITIINDFGFWKCSGEMGF